MGANTHHHKEFFLLANDTIFVGGGAAVGHIGVARDGIGKVGHGHRLGLFNLFGRAVADDDRIAAPFQGDGLAFGHRA